MKRKEVIALLTDCKESVAREVGLIKIHVTQIGEIPEHAKEAIAYAAEKVSCIGATPKQLQSFRRLVARLIGYRLARMDERERSAKKHLDLYSNIRVGLLRKGFAENCLRQLSAGVTERVGRE